MKENLLLLVIVLCMTIYGCSDAETDTSENNQPENIENAQSGVLPADNDVQPATPSDKQEEIVVYIYSDVFAPEISLEKISYKVEAVTSESLKEGIETELRKHYEGALKPSGLTLAFHAITQEGNRVIVDFVRNSFPCIGAGSQQERDVLNSLALTVINNLPDASEVIFRVEGGDYESGHFIFGKDELYDVKGIVMP